ncbi:MAG: hypothetical protein BMS9Abin37_3127 [Acidobacteriota bacterium]|nr:MAG: hypothetical protein BMS9Abin37_3127 [Acidobacteriota bacterium]
MKRRVLKTIAGCAFALALSSMISAAEIVELVPVIRSEGILVSFRVEDAFDEEILQAIESGLEVSFRYNVELRQVRRAWLDKKTASRQIQNTVAYDNLTKRYSLTREIDGEIDATELVDNPDAMRRFMTSFESLLLFDVSFMEPNEEYYLRMNGVMRDRNLLLLIPWDVGADWREAHFTYIP